MIVKYYNREYELKYDYNKCFKPYICNTDKHTFGLKLKNTDSYLSVSSPNSYLEAEEIVYKKYQEYLKCNDNHKWVRTYDHSKYGHCESCKLSDPYKFDSPYVCDHENCEESGEHALMLGYEMISKQGHFCKKHYLSTLSEQIFGWLEEYENLKEDYEATEHITYSYFNKIVYDFYQENNLLDSMSRVEEIKFFGIQSIVDFDYTVKTLFLELTENTNILKTNGSYWSFKGKLSPFEVIYCAYYFLMTQNLISKDDLKMYDKELESIKKILQTLPKES